MELGEIDDSAIDNYWQLYGEYIDQKMAVRGVLGVLTHVSFSVFELVLDGMTATPAILPIGVEEFLQMTISHEHFRIVLAGLCPNEMTE